MSYPGFEDPRFNVRYQIEQTATSVGAQDAVRGLSDLDAVRRLQEWEGYTPCFGRETALQPGPNGTCLVAGCCWRNFCAPYRQTAVPLDTFLSSEPELNTYVDFLLSRAHAHPTPGGLSVAIAERAPLTSLSRKLLIGSPKSTLYESASGANPLRPVRLSFRAENIGKPGGGQQQYTHYFRISRNILWTADPWRIFDWFKTAQPLFNTGVLDFLPHVTAQTDDVSVWKTNQPEFANLPSPEFRQLHTPHLASTDGQILVSDPNLVPLINVEIPFIENASLADIQRLITDHPEELAAFRSFLFSNIDKIRDKRLGSETFAADITAIERAIGDNLRKLNSDVRRHKLKHYVELAGGGLASFSLALFCLHHEFNVLSVVGPGGFAYVLSGRISDFLTSQVNLQDSPVHFLWLIGQSKRL